MSPTEPSPEPSPETLRYLHSAYLERFMSDNNRIWVTAATLVPLSLAGLPVFVIQEHPTVISTVAVGIASTLLLAFWNVTADAHRRFQERSLAVVLRIEGRLLGLELNDDLPVTDVPVHDTEPKSRGSWGARLRLFRSDWRRVQTARRLLLVLVALTWAALATAVGLGIDVTAVKP